MDYDRLRELQEKFDENPRRYFAPLANEYRKGGQPKRAIEICRAHLAQMPGHMSGQIVYGQSLYEAGEFDEAKEVFARALALDPENLIALRSMGDMSLQAGNTSEARTWYTRLLDTDPKDTAVIALVSEMDAAEEAAPVEPATEIPGIDTDAGDQEIPAAIETADLVFLSTDLSNPTPEGPSPAILSSADSSSPEASPAVPSSAEASPVPSSAVDQASADVASSAQSPSAEEAPIGLERHYPVQEPAPAVTSAAEAPPTLPGAAEGTAGQAAEGPQAEDLGVPAGASAAEGLTSAMPEAVNPLDWSGPPPDAPVEEQVAREPEPVARAAPEPARPAERTLSGASAEPFVNETMAQLYLQQGYKQLALQVYRQLAASRPQDEGLRNRIAEIEAADAAEHPGEVAPARKETPAAHQETPAAHRETPIERPNASEEIAGRQSSIREFFATLGRRRPPHPSSRGGSRSGNNQPAAADTRAPLGAAPPSATLDTVFAGATVSPADARAASRLAGAFSGAPGSGRTSPPTPPVPTPRVNPRVPQAQESEEDVAKFRAWLDGLTGE
jgi:tetratricopeptide (TPR) repeat protein